MAYPNHIADAYVYVARVNHYLVRVDTTQFTWDELTAAEQILIARENALTKTDKVLSRALDICEQDEKAKRSAS